ncbi:hypothetical protein YC2023_016214 [Brassica napus]
MPTDRGNSDGIPTEKASSSEFPRNFVKSPNGSPTAIIFPLNSSVFSEEPIFPRNFLGIFRRIDISSEFRRKFLGIFRGFHFPSEFPSEYRCFLVVEFSNFKKNFQTSKKKLKKYFENKNSFYKTGNWLHLFLHHQFNSRTGTYSTKNSPKP